MLQDILLEPSTSFTNRYIDCSSAYPGLDMRGFNQHMMQALCVAAGCDYLVRRPLCYQPYPSGNHTLISIVPHALQASLKGCGVKNSYKLIAKHGYSLSAAADLLCIFEVDADSIMNFAYNSCSTGQQHDC